jgi:hypothetical protein
MQRLCPRCRHAVTFDEDGALCYCGHCGAPQVRLSEELLGQSERAAAGEGLEHEGVPAFAAPTADPTAVNWRGAMLCALFCGGIAVVLEILSVLVPLASLLATFWAIGAPVVALGIYSAKFARTRIYPGFGARLGLLCGLAVITGITTVQSVELLLRRFVLHNSVAFDTLVNTSFAQMHAAALQQSGAAAAPMLKAFDLPEFRTGLLLSGIAAVCVLYVMFSVAGGAFAGLLRARKPVS